MKRALNDDRQPSRLYGAHLQSFAIVACAQPEDHIRTAKKLRKDLREQGMKKVDIYLYHTSKKTIEESDQKVGFSFYNGSFNWIGRLKDQELATALKTEYQVVMDLSEGHSFAADVLISKLKATWKVGRFIPEREYLLDLMISPKDNDLPNLVHHMDHYLKTLNKPTAA